MKKKIAATVFICLMFALQIYAQVDSKNLGIPNLEIIGAHEDVDNIICVGNSVILALLDKDYQTLSKYCSDEVRFSQGLGFSLKYDTLIEKNIISVADVSEHKIAFYRYEPDKYFFYDLKAVLNNYAPTAQRLSKVKINGLIKNEESEDRFLSIINEIFGDCVSLEYYTKETDLQIDWKCTILVLRKIGSVYKLVGISIDYWEP